MNNLFYSFNDFLKEKFGCRVHRLSLDGGFNCPNIDGRLSDKGCYYCNNKGFVGYLNTAKPLSVQIEESMQFARARFKAEKFIAYFQSFTSTYADIDSLREKYDLIKRYPEIVGISISTRPDNLSMSEEKLDLISEYKKDYMVWLEYGLQSANDKTLEAVNRNHTAEDFSKWVKLSKDRGFLVGAHVILGFPQEKKEDVFYTADFISKNNVDGVKLHCFHILKDTVYEDVYKQGKFKLFSQSEYVELTADFLERIDPKIVILRLVSNAFGKSLVAPYWINDKQKVIISIEKELLSRNSYQGKLFRV